MGTTTALATFAAGLAVVFGAAVGVGNAVGPSPTNPAPAHDEPAHDEPAHDEPAHDEPAHDEPAHDEPAHDEPAHDEPAHDEPAHDEPAHDEPAVAGGDVAGLAVSQDGYALQLVSAPREAGVPSALEFRITGPDGMALLDYREEHEKELHLVVVRRDATGYQHLHPQRTADGTWTTPLVLTRAGSWKVFADFTPAGAASGLTLATDLSVAGPLDVVAPPPPEQRTSRTDDGYVVSVEGDLRAGESSSLLLLVTRDGRPVVDLQPYLGAHGHLVALREGDLAYLHVHPEGVEPAGGVGGPGIAFAVDVPSAGTYRLFLDFQHGGVVRTAALSLPAVAATGGAR